MKSSSSDDPKAVYKIYRNKFSSLKTNFTKAVLFLIKDESNIVRDRERSESDHSHVKQIKFKTIYELIAKLKIIEILAGQSGSKLRTFKSRYFLLFPINLIL